MQSLQGKASSTTENSALREWCMKAKAEVDRLRGENEILKQMIAEQADVTAISATLRPLSFPTVSVRESGLVTQASPQLGGGMSGIGTPRVSPLPAAGQGAAAFFTGPVMGPAGSTPFPPPWLDREGVVCFYQARIWRRPA